MRPSRYARPPPPTLIRNATRTMSPLVSSEIDCTFPATYKIKKRSYRSTGFFHFCFFPCYIGALFPPAWCKLGRYRELSKTTDRTNQPSTHPTTFTIILEAQKNPRLARVLFVFFSMSSLRYFLFPTSLPILLPGSQAPCCPRGCPDESMQHARYVTLDKCHRAAPRAFELW